jgi:hypothetical protein
LNAIDFANSYMTWFPVNDADNIARIQLDAACTMIDDRAGAAETYYLVAPCRSERMYVDTPLFLMPNYEFAGVWGKDDFQIIRTHWVSARDNREYGHNRVRWADVRLDIQHFAGTRPLVDTTQIIEAVLANQPLVARTELRNEESGRRATLEYPVKIMNLTKSPPQFQVDTGPLIVPDFTSKAEHPVERFDVAHVVYNGFTKAEFILRRPTPVVSDGGMQISTTDYSTVMVVPAKHEIYCGTTA